MSMLGGLGEQKLVFRPRDNERQCVSAKWLQLESEGRRPLPEGGPKEGSSDIRLALAHLRKYCVEFFFHFFFF